MSQICALIAGRRVYESGPQHLTLVLTKIKEYETPKGRLWHSQQSTARCLRRLTHPCVKNQKETRRANPHRSSGIVRHSAEVAIEMQNDFSLSVRGDRLGRLKGMPCETQLYLDSPFKTVHENRRKSITTEISIETPDETLENTHTRITVSQIRSESKIHFFPTTPVSEDQETWVSNPMTPSRRSSARV